MNTLDLLNTLKKANEHTNTVSKHTLIVNDKSETQGALFFIPINGKEFKVLIPAPFHSEVLSDDKKPTYLQVLQHKEAFILK